MKCLGVTSFYGFEYHDIAKTVALVRLAGCQPASSVFLSHHFSTSHQPPTSQHYFSLTTNQHQPLATSQPNEAVVFLEL
jgi:hypothetical protein